MRLGCKEEEMGGGDDLGRISGKYEAGSYGWNWEEKC